MSQFGIAPGMAGATLCPQCCTAEHGTLCKQMAVQSGVQADTAQLGQPLTELATLLARLDYFYLLMVVAAFSAAAMLTQREFR